MTPEELMKPRYKVIADYPDTVFKVGHIIEQVEVDEGQNLYNMDFFLKYPAIFKKLEWYEREPKDLEGIQFGKILSDGYVFELIGAAKYIQFDRFIPITKEEYEQFNQSK